MLDPIAPECDGPSHGGAGRIPRQKLKVLADCLEDHGFLQRLGQASVRAGATPLLVRGLAGGDHEDRRVRKQRVGLEHPADVKSRHSLHLAIEKQEGRPLSARDAQGLGSAAGGQKSAACAKPDLLSNRAEEVGIIHEQDRLRHACGNYKGGQVSFAIGTSQTAIRGRGPLRILAGRTLSSRGMDTLTHGVAGSVLARMLTDRPGARAALVTGLAASMWPDLDFLFLSGRLDYLQNHRGWSHCFLFLPFFAFGLALLARFYFRAARLVDLWFFCAVGIASHIAFDWITSFGTMFWYPLSRARYSLDWVFILDPIFTGIVSLALLAAVVWRRRGRLFSALGAILLGSYIVSCAALHQKALRTWERLDRPPEGSRVAVLPQFLSPFRWLGLNERPGEVHVAFFDIGPFARGAENPRPPERFSEILTSLWDFYPPPKRARIRRFLKPPDSVLLDAARALPDVQIYLAFARFPLATVVPQSDGGAAITWEDLRFLPWFAGPWGTDRGGRFRREPFVYRVRLDAVGRPLERSFIPSGLRPFPSRP